MLKTQRYAYIDALRGWAILAVILVHVWIWTGAQSDFFGKVASHGAIGVQLFYIISAFTLLLSLNRRREAGQVDWRSYFWRRFLRIAPLFYVAMLIYGPMWHFVPRYWMPEGIQFWHILSALTFTHGWHPKSVNAIVPGGWSMAVEMSFYLVFPLLFACLINWPRIFIALVISLFLAIFVSDWAFQYYQTEIPARFGHVLKNFAYTYIPTAQLPVFLLGFMVYQLVQIDWFNSDSKAKGLALILLSLMLLVLLLYWQPPWLPKYFNFSLSLSVLVIGLKMYPAFLLVNPLIIKLGELSYSLYLIHFGVIFIVKTLLTDHLDFANKDIKLLTGFAIVLAISTVIASLSYRLVEQPALNLAKKINASA